MSYAPLYDNHNFALSQGRTSEIRVLAGVLVVFLKDLAAEQFTPYTLCNTYRQTMSPPRNPYDLVRTYLRSNPGYGHPWPIRSILQTLDKAGLLHIEKSYWATPRYLCTITPEGKRIALAGIGVTSWQRGLDLLKERLGIIGGAH